MMAEYNLVRDRLGSQVAPDTAARIMVQLLQSNNGTSI